MKNRTLPYGYCRKDGVIVIEPQESKVLKQIYAAYLDGSSMLTIAEQLNREKIEYRDGVTGWNKGRLKHLIDNAKYLGTEVYPPIIDQETYEKIQKTKHGRNTQRKTDKTQDIFKLTVPVLCPSCGDRMRRRHDSRCKCQERWTCENTACRLRIEISDAELLTALADLLGTVTADSIKMPVESPYEPSTEVIRLNNEIGRMLDMAEIDKTVLRSKMTECFRQKYKELGNECCAVQRLKAEVGSTADIAERLNRTVSEIRLYTDKTADIILLNGQIIRKENSHATDNGRPAESGADKGRTEVGRLMLDEDIRFITARDSYSIASYAESVSEEAIAIWRNYESDKLAVIESLHGVNGYEFFPEDGKILYYSNAREMADKARSLWLSLNFAGEYPSKAKPVRIKRRNYVPMFPPYDFTNTVENVRKKFLKVFSEEFTDQTLNRAIAEKELMNIRAMFM